LEKQADGRELVLTRYTEVEPELSLLLKKLKLEHWSCPPNHTRNYPSARIATPSSADLRG
jgi:hypothetical protein